MKKNETLIVLSIGEVDQQYVKNVVEEIRGKFSEDFRSGLLEIIAPKSFYHIGEVVKIQPSLNETIDRVRWRSNENLDVKILMSYARNKGKYFMMVEDDVITKPTFITKTQEFIKNSEKETKEILGSCLNSASLEPLQHFSIQKIIAYLNIFYQVKPIDWLFDEFSPRNIAT